MCRHPDCSCRDRQGVRLVCSECRFTLAVHQKPERHFCSQSVELAALDEVPHQLITHAHKLFSLICQSSPHGYLWLCCKLRSYRCDTCSRVAGILCQGHPREWKRQRRWVMSFYFCWNHFSTNGETFIHLLYPRVPELRITASRYFLHHTVLDMSYK